MKQKGTYAICVLILVCLIFSAFYAPSLMMKWNDYQLLQKYEFQERNGIDYDAINTSYIIDGKERLNDFAQGIGEGRQYYITSTGEEPETWDDILPKVFGQEMAFLLQDMGIMWPVEGFYDSRNMTAWDHYVIYDNDSVEFLCWYIELTTQEQMVRILFDAMDYTIYYVECYHQGIFEIFREKYTKDTMDWSWLTYALVHFHTIYGNENYILSYGWEEAVVANLEKKKDKQINEETDSRVSAGETHELLSEIQFEDGSLQLKASILDCVDELYGVGIGIEELKELLPEEQIGEYLVSFG